MDPHDPYDPPARFRALFQKPGDRLTLDRPRETDIEAVLGEGGSSLPQVRDHLSDLYDAEIAHNDAEFGSLLDELKRRGLYDSTLIVFISDHGEEFLDHGGWAHARTLYREMLHVPLILKLPHGESAGRKVTRPVQQIDVLPSLLRAAGAAALPRDARGMPLQELLGSDEGTDAGVDIASYLLSGRSPGREPHRTG